MSLWGEKMNSTSPYSGNQENHPGNINDKHYQRGNVVQMQQSKNEANWQDPELGEKTTSPNNKWNIINKIDDKLPRSSTIISSSTTSSSTSSISSSIGGILAKNYLRKFSTYLRNTTNGTTTTATNKTNTISDQCEIHENFNTQISIDHRNSSIPQPPPLPQKNSSSPSLNINNTNNYDRKGSTSSINDDLIIKDNSSDINSNCDKIIIGDVNNLSDIKNSENKIIKVTSITNSGGGGKRDNNVEIGLNSSFLLPRIILKQTTTTNNNDGNGDVDDDTGFDRCYDKNDRERVTSSHYSTEKSGSSGYYSSNLYSTSSVDEHIYSEPVIECIQLTTPTPTQTLITNTQIINGNRTSGVGRERQQLHGIDEIIYEDEEQLLKRKTDKLPTIMEGIDGQIPRPVWPSDFDDSLIDINLESFLLPNETSGITITKCSPILNNPFNKRTIQQQSLYNNNYPENVPHNNNNNNNPDKSLSIYLRKCEDNINVQQTRDILKDIREKLNNLLEQHTGHITTMTTATTTATTLNETNTNPFIIEDYQNAPINKMTDLEKEIKSLRGDLDNYLKMINQENEKEIKQLCAGLSKNTKMLTIKKALENKTRSITSMDDAYEIFQYENESGYEKMMPQRRNLTNYHELDHNVQSHFDTVYVQDGYQMDTNPFSRQYSVNSRADPNFHFKRKLTNNNYSDCGIMMINDDSIGSGSGNIDDDNHHQQHNSFSDESENNSINYNNVNITSENLMIVKRNQLKKNLSLHRPTLIIDNLSKSLINMSNTSSNNLSNNSSGNNNINNNNNNNVNSDKDNMIQEWHKNKPSIWELYYGTNRPSSHQTFAQKIRSGVANTKKKKKKKKKNTLQSIVAYPSTRPESDFTLDLPRAEQLRTKMKHEKQFRSRCRILMTFFSLIFFLLTVMAVSLILTRGKRMFGSML